MHDHIASIKQHPTQKFHKKPQKPQNLGLKCMKNEGFKTLTKCFDLGLGRKSHW